MTDTHTHILPGMDDGAANLAESLRLLRRCRAQGVKTVVLTSHFYPDRESADSFLERRAQAFAQLQAAVTPDLPRLVLGAEVGWCAGLERMDRLEELTMGQTNYLLLELPYMSWTEEQLNGVWSLVEGGRVVPVLAHVDRYLHMQRRGQYEALADMHIPMQLSAVIFRKLLKRRKALKLLSQGQWMIGSDCHNLSDRPPCMAEAARYLQTHAPKRMDALNWAF